MAQRQNSQRPTFSRLTTFPYGHPIDDTLNPYIYLLGADDDNIQTISTFIRSFGNTLSHQVTCNKVLGQTLGIESGVTIMVHHYAPLSFPTWHRIPEQGTLDQISSTAYATAVGFRAPLPVPVPANYQVIAYPPAPAIPAQGAPVPAPIFAPLLYQVQDVVYDHNLDPDPVQTFRPKDTTPDVYYFNPWDSTTTQYAHNSVNGLKIETSNIAGFAVPQPNTTQGVHVKNSHVLNSAILCNQVVPAALINAASPFHHMPTETYDEVHQPTLMVKKYLHMNRLPRFPRAFPPNPAGVVARPHGFDRVSMVRSFLLASTIFISRHGSVDHAAVCDSMPVPHIYAWSSYRYVSPHLPRNVTHPNRTSFILNFRTLYGTNVTLARSKHPFALIPIC